jgi:hypothetical protein
VHGDKGAREGGNGRPIYTLTLLTPPPSPPALGAEKLTVHGSAFEVFICFGFGFDFVSNMNWNDIGCFSLVFSMLRSRTASEELHRASSRRS